MRPLGAGAKLRVELARNEIRVVLTFYNLRQYTLMPARHMQANITQLFDIGRVKLIAVAVALFYAVFAVEFMGQ